MPKQFFVENFEARFGGYCAQIPDSRANAFFRRPKSEDPFFVILPPACLLRGSEPAVAGVGKDADKATLTVEGDRVTQIQGPKCASCRVSCSYKGNPL